MLYFDENVTSLEKTLSKSSLPALVNVVRSLTDYLQAQSPADDLSCLLEL